MLASGAWVLAGVEPPRGLEINDDVQWVRDQLATMAPIHPVTVLVIPGEPPAKERPRFRVHESGKVNVYTPKATRDAEAALAGWLTTRRPLSGELAIAGRFHLGIGRRKADEDNCVKALLDAGNKAAWTDDALVMEQRWSMRRNARSPRIVVGYALL